MPTLPVKDPLGSGLDTESEKSMSCTRSLLPALAALLAFGASAQSFSDVTLRDADGLRFSVSGQDGQPAVLDPQTIDLTLLGGFQQSLHEGSASASQQTLRGLAALSTYHPVQPNLFAANTNASFFKHVQVLPGSSSLQWGDPVQFDLVLRFDGNFGAGLLNPLVFPNALTYIDIARTLASVEVRLDYRITDLDQTVPGCDECGPPDVMGFGYYGTSFFDAKFYAWDGAEGRIESRWAPDGDWIGAVPASHNDYLFIDNDVRVGEALIHFPNTSLRSYAVSTFVGNTLEIKGDLGIFVQAMGQGSTAQASGYSLYSFDADLVSTQGLEFVGESPGAYAVPEPGTWATMLAGLAFMAHVSRRRWQR